MKESLKKVNKMNLISRYVNIANTNRSFRKVCVPVIIAILALTNIEACGMRAMTCGISTCRNPAKVPYNLNGKDVYICGSCSSKFGSQSSYPSTNTSLVISKGSPDVGDAKGSTKLNNVVHEIQSPSAVQSVLDSGETLQALYVIQQEPGDLQKVMCVAVPQSGKQHSQMHSAAYSSDSPKPKTIKGISMIARELQKNHNSVISITKDIDNEEIILINDIDKSSIIVGLSSGDDIEDHLRHSLGNEQQALLFLEDMLELEEIKRHRKLETIRDIDKLKTHRPHIESAHGEINKRMSSMSYIEGIASGDADNLYVCLNNVWISTIFGNNRQGLYKGRSGYKGKTKGVTVGSDFKINDTALLGFAYGNINADFRYMNNHIGDRLKSNSHVFALYGSRELNNWLLQATLSASISHVKTQDLRPTIFDANNTAYGKFRSHSYGVEAILTYRMETGSNPLIYPYVGFRGAYYKDKPYTESGGGIYNRNIVTKANHELVSTIGSRFIAPYKISKYHEITPSLNASVEYTFYDRSQKVKTKFVWAENYQTSYAFRGKYPKMGYNIGAGLAHKYKNMEILMDYNYHFRQKYHNHYYALKFKLFL